MKKYFRMTLKDDGTGLPSSFRIEQSISMRINLMRGLSQEIDAEFKICTKSGTTITVSFVYDMEYANGIPSINSPQAQAI